MRTNKKRSCGGFTLAELLIVIAIIGVLIAISIPIFANQLEKSRESTDLANVRSAYAKVTAEAMLGNTGATETVVLKQKKDDWQSLDPVNIGGVTHYKAQADTANWKGVAAANGNCVVSYDESCGVVFTWSGTAAPPAQSYPFNTSENDFFSSSLYQTDFWKNGDVLTKDNFEFDSRCDNSIYIPAINEAIEKMDNSLLQQPDCTWAYLGSGRKNKEADRYLYWTSLNTNNVGVGKQIPVIIQTGDGKFYVSETTTGKRSGKNYVTVSKRLDTNGYKQVLKDGKEYSSLQEAYDAYSKALADPKYDAVRK